MKYFKPFLNHFNSTHLPLGQLLRCGAFDAQEMKFTDMILCAENDVDLPCHRVVLAKRSEVFDRMLSSDTWIEPYWDWVLGHCWWSRLPTSCWARFLIMRLINVDDDRGPWGGYHLYATMHNASRCKDSRLGFLGTTYHILSCDSIVFCEVWWNTDAFHSSSSSSLFGHHQ